MQHRRVRVPVRGRGGRVPHRPRLARAEEDARSPSGGVSGSVITFQSGVQ